MKPLSEADADFFRLMRTASPLDRALAKAATTITLALIADKAPHPLRTDIIMSALALYRHEICEVLGHTTLGGEKENLSDEQSVRRLCQIALVSLNELPKAHDRLINLVEALKGFLPTETEDQPQ
jgi:hypothetical protein